MARRSSPSLFTSSRTDEDIAELSELYPDIAPEELELLAQLPVQPPRDVYNEALGDYNPRDEHEYGTFTVLAREPANLSETEARTRAVKRVPEANDAAAFRTARFWVFYRIA